MTDLLIDHALDYAEQGFEIFPVDPQTKAPIGALAHNGMKDATTEQALVFSWWEARPDALIGCRIPEDIVVLDIDPRHGGDTVWQALLDENGSLTSRCHYSGRGDGGFHIWLKAPDGRLNIKPLNDWAQAHDVGEAISDTKHTAGIDLLHHGHRYSILPPSPHPETGEPYTWANETDPVQCPDWLAPYITAQMTVAPFYQLAHPSRQRAPEVSIADWFSDNSYWNDILEPYGWRSITGNGDDDGSTWKHPNATATTSATIKHGCLFVYSPNTPFEVTEDGDPHGYTRFRAYAILEHSGDLRAAARAAAIASGQQHQAPGTAAASPDATAAPPEEFDEPDGRKLKSFAQFVLDDNATIEPLWGEHDEILWASGEGLIIAGGIGAGKTTLMVQLLSARLGITDQVLGYPVTPTDTKCLYLAMDRPSQIRRAMRRLFKEPDREALERGHVWEGPPPSDVAKRPSILLELCQQAGADTLFIDSLKDAAIRLSDDEVGSAVNRALQLCVANGVQTVSNHHNRKAQGDNKRPNKLDDLYGSTWIASGAGSVIYLFGSPGDSHVELIHLKQPAGIVGPLNLEHDHEAGTTTARATWDPLAFLRHLPTQTADSHAAAQAMTGKTMVTRPDTRKAQRVLERLVKRGLVQMVSKGGQGGTGGSARTQYQLVDNSSTPVDNPVDNSRPLSRPPPVIHRHGPQHDHSQPTKEETAGQSTDQSTTTHRHGPDGSSRPTPSPSLEGDGEALDDTEPDPEGLF
jgi:hypothetical protein